MVSVGFSARPASWYTIDTLRARMWRSAPASSAMTSCPATRIVPAVIAPPRGRARRAASATVDLPQPDSPTNP